MDLPRVNHSKQVGHVHFLHIPGIERTKIPDQTQHTAIFRIVNVHSDGLVVVDSYEVGKSSAIAEFAYSFNLNDWTKANSSSEILLKTNGSWGVLPTAAFLVSNISAAITPQNLANVKASHPPR